MSNNSRSHHGDTERAMRAQKKTGLPCSTVAPSVRTDDPRRHDYNLHDIASSYGYEIMLTLILKKEGVTSRSHVKRRLFTEMDKIERAWWSPENHRFLRPAEEQVGYRQPLQRLSKNSDVRRQHGCFPSSAGIPLHGASARADACSVPYRRGRCGRRGHLRQPYPRATSDRPRITL